MWILILTIFSQESHDSRASMTSSINSVSGFTTQAKCMKASQIWLNSINKENSIIKSKAICVPS